MDFVRTFSGDELRDLCERHRVQLHSAKEIGAQSLKVVAHKPVFFCARFFLAEGDLEVATGQMPIIWQHKPREKSEDLAEPEDRAQRQRDNQSESRAIEEIDKKVEHAGQPVP